MSTGAVASISGLISGMDTESIISKLMAIEQKPLDQLNSQIDKANEQKAAFTSINTSLLALKTSITDLGRSYTWDTKSTSVSNSSVLTATASTATKAGSYTFKVVQLAAASQLGSTGFADSDTTLVGAGTFDLTVGTSTQSITVGASDTLDDVAAAINAKDMGVSAVVVNTGQGATPYKLVLTSESTGLANATSISNNTVAGLSFSTLSAAEDSIVEFGTTSPVQVHSASNSVTGLAPGLTLNLLTESASPVTVTVSNDDSSLATKAQDFVTKYNAVMDNIEKYTKYDTEAEKAAVLFGNSALRFLQNDLGVMISTTVTGQPAATSSLTMVGFSFSDDGTLSLDETAFKSALSTYHDDVATLFSGVTDIAQSSHGSTIATTAVADAGFSVANLLNGDTDSDNFGAANGFQTSTIPATFTVNFGATRQVSQILINSINSVAMPGTSYSIRDFTIDLQDTSGAWSTLKTVTGSTAADYTYTLDQVTSAKGFRITVNSTNAPDGKIRLVELGANEETGAAKQMSNLLDFITRSVDGVIATEQSSLDTKITDLNTAVTRMEERLTAKEAQLRTEFAAMESAMAKMQSQSQQLAAQLGGSSSG